MAEAPLVGVIMGSDSDLPCMAAACEKLKQFGVRPSERAFSNEALLNRVWWAAAREVKLTPHRRTVAVAGAVRGGHRLRPPHARQAGLVLARRPRARAAVHHRRRRWRRAPARHGRGDDPAARDRRAGQDVRAERALHMSSGAARACQADVASRAARGACAQGVDSLYSIVQMPRGVPVATVAIGNAENAGLLAVRPRDATCQSACSPLHPLAADLRLSACGVCACLWRAWVCCASSGAHARCYSTGAQRKDGCLSGGG
jgi:phosphoribosylcarboxyaminoimidazole (NCAIR) mutase